MCRFILCVVLLGAGLSVRAQSTEQILKELSAVNGSPAPAVKSVSPAVAVPAEKPIAAPAAVASAKPEKPAGTLRRYLDSRGDARELRDAKESAMDQVAADWNGMVLREYSLSADARMALALDGMEETTDIRARFPEVYFGKGSYAVFRPKMNGLFVLNTSDQVAQFESVLASLQTTTEESQQVEIESRFIEFEQGALQELGFNWTDVQDGKSIAAAGQWAIKDGENLFNDSLRTMPFNQPGALGEGEIGASGEWTARRLEDMFNGPVSGTGTGEASISGAIGSKSLDLLIRALDQASGVDVLSAPRVVTLSGKEARIQVGQRHYYPEVYEAGVSIGALLHVKYSDFKEKLLGVDMRVVPTIKGDEISMTINPKINDLIGWQQHELSPADTSYNSYQGRVGNIYQHGRIVARLPVFKEREIKTDVVVRDGSTVAMGGLISEKAEAFSDRVPVLGSIPLVGRLFRSEGERTVKRNLMIFVTAKKVQPNGLIVAEKTFDAN